MSRSILRHPLLALCALATLCGCPGAPAATSATIGGESESTSTSTTTGEGTSSATATTTATTDATTEAMTSAGPSTGEPCPPGGLGCTCLEGQVCDEPLICAADVCVEPAPGGCGDGVIQVGEACDAGPANGPGAACKADCTQNVCGDGDVGPGELCDDGNTVDDDACTNDCTLESCGDGVLQAGEACDDGDADETDACLSTCTPASCGDGHVWAGTEACDLGPDNADDATCTASCEAASCGDGLLWSDGEACDDGNAVDDDGCTNACTLPACGDGVLQIGEACDDGNQDDGDGCSKLCQAPGGLIWEAIWDPDDESERSEFGAGIACDLDGRAIAVGRQNMIDSWTQALIVAFDASGQELWFRTKHVPDAVPYSDHFNAVATDSKNNIYAVGKLYNIVMNGVDQDWMVLKYSPAGDELWLDTRDTWTVDDAYSVRIAANDDPIVGGHDTTQSGFRGLVIRYSPDKAVQWTHTINGGGVTITDGLALTGAGDILALTRSTMGTPTLRRLTPAGAVSWTVNLEQSIVWNGLTIDGAGRIIAVGTQPGVDIVVRQFDAAGAELWTRVHDQEGGNDFGFEVEAAADGSIFVVGRVTANGSDRAWLRKYDPAGAEVWTDFDPASTISEWADVALCPDGTIVTVGALRPGEVNLIVHKYAP